MHSFTTIICTNTATEP